MEEELKKLIRQADDKIDLYRAPRFAIEDAYKKVSPGATDLNVVIIAAPCNGFGDIVFATKFARYIRYGLNGRGGYSTNVTILTPAVKMFQQLGVTDIPIVSLHGTHLQCRRLKNFKRPSNFPRQDVIFVAPLMADFEIDYADVHSLLKESNPFNTLFLSEYNDDPAKGFDLLTGVGKFTQGMLFDELPKTKKPAALAGAPYALMYIAKGHGIQYCGSNFAKMVVKKYRNHRTFQLVAPDWLAEKLAENGAFKRFAKQYFPQIIFYQKGAQKNLTTATAGHKLLIRGDIFPVSRPIMISLMRYSVRDILVTGDQSVTDAINCCKNKNIWYQVVPWKTALAKELAKAIPQSYLSKSKTACGTITAMRIRDLTTTKIKRENDFRKKAKHILDSTFKAINDSKDPETIVAKYLKELTKTTNKQKLSNSISI